MKTPRICASITNTDLKAVRRVESRVDLFEVRIDLIGDDWSRGRPFGGCNDECYLEGRSHNHFGCDDIAAA